MDFTLRGAQNNVNILLVLIRREIAYTRAKISGSLHLLVKRDLSYIGGTEIPPAAILVVDFELTDEPNE